MLLNDLMTTQHLVELSSDLPTLYHFIYLPERIDSSYVCDLVHRNYLAADRSFATESREVKRRRDDIPPEYHSSLLQTPSSGVSLDLITGLFGEGGI